MESTRLMLEQDTHVGTTRTVQREGNPIQRFTVTVRTIGLTRLNETCELKTVSCRDSHIYMYTHVHEQDL